MTAYAILALEERQAIEHIERLVQEDPDAALPILLNVAAAGRKAVSQAVIESLDATVRSSEKRLRSSLRHERLSTFWFAERSDLVRALHQSPHSFGLAVACSFCPDGHVREAATLNLTRWRDGSSLAYLMLRSADWVGVVSKRAAEAALDQLTSVPNQAVVECFSAFLVLEGSESGSASSVVIAYRQQLVSRVGVLTGIRTAAPPRQVAWLIDHEFLGPGESWEELLRKTIAESEPVSVAAAVRHIDSLPEAVQVSMLEGLLARSVVQARLAAIDIAARYEQLDFLAAGLYDHNWRVRNNARYYLEKRGRAGFAEEYRARFPELSALAGFGEVALDADLNELLPYIEHPSAKVREEAIHALGKRNARSAGDLIAGHITDPSIAVIRTVIKALRRIRFSFPGNVLEGIMGDVALPLNARRAIEQALNLVPRWDRLSAILLLGQRGALTSEPSSLLTKWMAQHRRDMTGPSTVQLKRAQAELGPAQALLHPATYEAVLGEVLYWSKRLLH